MSKPVDFDKVIILEAGHFGIQWKQFDSPLGKTNPLCYTCLECKKTTAGVNLPAHEKGCKTGLLLQLGLDFEEKEQE